MDVQGHYEFETIKPGFYGASAHVHYRILITVLTNEEDSEGPYLHSVFDILL